MACTGALALSAGAAAATATAFSLAPWSGGGSSRIEPQSGRRRQQRPRLSQLPSLCAGGELPAVARSAYVNLPFCRRRCYYCDFPIKVVGDRPGAAAEAAEPYVAHLLQEIRSTRSSLGRQAAPDTGLDTVFFGGGTPSLCPPELMGRVLAELRSCFGIAPGAEICMEMDPGTFDKDLLDRFLALGLTRLSLGVQSFDAGLLAACGRAHTLEDVRRAMELIHSAGFDNFSIDVISGLPGQTLEQWERTLAEAVGTGAAHISVYDLQVEEGTAFGRWARSGTLPLPGDSLGADMYRAASQTLREAGYEHYEISNYARPGSRCRHNLTYWKNWPCLAFGNGAASYLGGHRFARPRGLPEYFEWVGRLRERGWAEATGSGEYLAGGGGAAKQDELLDTVMVGLRLREGLDLTELAQRHGRDAVDRIEAGAGEGLRNGWVDEVESVDVEEEKISGSSGPGGRRIMRLRDPEGFLLSNEVISSIFCELDA